METIMITILVYYFIVIIRTVNDGNKNTKFNNEIIELECKIAHDISSRNDKIRNDINQRKIDDLNAINEYKMNMMMELHNAIIDQYKPKP